MNKTGFTLLELLIVVLIIGILTTIALPYYFRAAERSRMAEAEVLMGNVVQAQERYKIRTGNKYARNWKALDMAPLGVGESEKYCTKAAGETTEENCGNGFMITLYPSTGSVSAPSPVAGVIAKRVNGGHYKYSLGRFYENDKTVYCRSDDGGADSQAVCIDFSSSDVYDEQGAKNVTVIETQTPLAELTE